MAEDPLLFEHYRPTGKRYHRFAYNPKGWWERWYGADVTANEILALQQLILIALQRKPTEYGLLNLIDLEGDFSHLLQPLYDMVGPDARALGFTTFAVVLPREFQAETTTWRMKRLLEEQPSQERFTIEFFRSYATAAAWLHSKGAGTEIR